MTFLSPVRLFDCVRCDDLRNSGPYRMHGYVRCPTMYDCRHFRKNMGIGERIDQPDARGKLRILKLRPSMSEHYAVTGIDKRITQRKDVILPLLAEARNVNGWF